MTPEIEPGRCAFCGCTDEHQGGAAPWANDEHTCCSICDAVLKRLAHLPELGYQRVIELTDATREALSAIRNA